MVVIAVLIGVTKAAITTATMAASKAYSIALAPSSLRQKCLKREMIFTTVLLIVLYATKPESLFTRQAVQHEQAPPL